MKIKKHDAVLIVTLRHNSANVQQLSDAMLQMKNVINVTSDVPPNLGYYVARQQVSDEIKGKLLEYLTSQ